MSVLLRSAKSASSRRPLRRQCRYRYLAYLVAGVMESWTRRLWQRSGIHTLTRPVPAFSRSKQWRVSRSSLASAHLVHRKIYPATRDRVTARRPNTRVQFT